ncbi:DMT family transporter [Legionella drozanskii]|nr:DMT family transporter [Legionella drozanskii]
MNHHDQNKSIFYVALSGLFFGLIGYFGISVLNAHISVPNMLFWRFLFSGLFMGLLILPQAKGQSFSRKAFINIFIYGGAFYGASSILYFVAAKNIGSGLAMVLFFTYPAIVMMLNFFLYNQPVRRSYYIAVIMIFIGMFCLMRGGSFQFNLIGILLSLLSALLYAFYIITSKNTTAPALVSTLLVCFGAMSSCFIAVLVDHSFIVPQGTNVWLNLIGLSVICTSLPILLLLKGLQHIGSLQASILSVLEPVFVLIFGVTLLGETVSLIQFVGVAILLLGALLALLN